MEKSFFEILSENKAVSEVVSEGIELFIMFSEIEFSSTNNNYYYRNKMFEKLEKNFKKYNFSQKQRLYLLVNYGLNVIFNNFERSKKMYDLFLDTIKEDLESAKEFLNDNLEENKLEYSFLLHFFIRENLINKKDQQRLLAMSEEILIRDLKELFEEKAWKWHPSKFRNLGFLYINKHVSGINEKQAFLEGFGRVKKSCDITPDFTACSFLGDVYLELNEKNDAMKYYQRACAAGATDNVVQSFEGGVKLWQLTCGMYELLKQGSR